MHQESLIGFDAREMWLDVNKLWPLARKETFLINLDISKPLSTDRAVWQSVFDLNSKLTISDEVRWRQKLWSSWMTLEKYLNDVLQEKLSYWTIAVTQHLETDLEKPLYDSPPLILKEELKTWEFLGYDVSEETLLSGLLNFGGDLSEMKFASEKYATHLNNHHLFSMPEYAIDYKNWCNSRDPGHGPFYVFGLYVVNKN